MIIKTENCTHGFLTILIQGRLKYMVNKAKAGGRMSLKHPWRAADLRRAKLLLTSSILALHHSAQRQHQSELQAPTLNKSRAFYWTPWLAINITSVFLFTALSHARDKKLEEGYIAWQSVLITIGAENMLFWRIGGFSWWISQEGIQPALCTCTAARLSPAEFKCKFLLQLYYFASDLHSFTRTIHFHDTLIRSRVQPPRWGKNLCSIPHRLWSLKSKWIATLIHFTVSILICYSEFQMFKLNS